MNYDEKELEKKLRKEVKGRKKTVCLASKEVHDSDLTKFIDELFNIQRDAVMKGLTELSVSFDIEEGYYDSKFVTMRIEGRRTYTEEDIKEDVSNTLSYYKKRDEADRKELERLKEKFGEK